MRCMQLRSSFILALAVGFLVFGASGRLRAEQSAVPSDAPPTIDIVEPQPEQSLWNIAGKLGVVVATEGRVPSDARIVIHLDGRRAGSAPGDARKVDIDAVWRGTHVLRAELRQGDAVLANSPPVRFYVHQHSVQHRN